MQLSDREDPSMIPTEIEEKTSMLPAKQYSSSSENLMLNFLNYIVKSRGFYSALADNLCQDESFAERKDEHCWNGERIGGYVISNSHAERTQLTGNLCLSGILKLSLTLAWIRKNTIRK